MGNGKTAVVIFGSDSIWQLDDKPGVLYWTCALAIDADGHPKCYHPSGSPPGLDYLENAGSPGNWWGIACNPDTTGKPYVQSSTDPAPGFYVSTTALVDGAFPASSPSKYVNSGTVPFVVLPSKPKFSDKQQLGDLCMCFNNATGKCSWAIYADIGPSNQIGEGSMALADALGISSDPKSGGTSNESIAMVYFPGSRIGWPRSNAELQAEACDLFNGWGGYESAKIAMPQFNWDQFPPIGIPVPPKPGPALAIVTVNAPSSLKVSTVQSGVGSDVTVTAPPNVTVKIVQV
jgi:Fungal chitosanase of glycosyl hydrolase group 75